MQKLPREIIQIILKIKWWNARKEFLEKNLILPKFEKVRYECDEYGHIQDCERYKYYTTKNNKHYDFCVYIDDEYGNLAVSCYFSCDGKNFEFTYFEVFF